MSAETSLRIALAQVDVTVGDLDANAERIERAIDDARSAGAALVVLPELALTGYPPEDLLLKRGFLEAASRTLSQLAAGVDGLVALVGCPEHDGGVYNSLAVLAGGRVHGSYRKMLLPNYGVFDEHRYFRSGAAPAMIELDGALVGLTVCEDIWEPGPPASEESQAGAALIVNASASPFHRGKGVEREEMIARRAREHGVAIAFCNLVGGQDELVFDGQSAMLDHTGALLARAPQFEEAMLVSEVSLARHRPGDVRLLASVEGRGDGDGAAGRAATIAEPLDEIDEVYGALVRGLRDYARKNGFSRAVLGVSGGVDSALVAALAADALGPESLTCVVMPSGLSSPETQADARRLAENLGCELLEIPIHPIQGAFSAALADSFAGTEPDEAEENVQARIRGTLIMALSNKFGWLALATGNKSEMSVGYATLYGDMAGGLAPIKDVPKTLVYRLVEHISARTDGELIPRSIVERPPTAELRAGQLDTDTLPPYELLDEILEGYVERDEGVEELIEAGMPASIVAEVVRMVDGAEHKRRQAPPGIRITPKAFGRDRRLPITNRFRQRARSVPPP